MLYNLDNALNIKYPPMGVRIFLAGGNVRTPSSFPFFFPHPVYYLRLSIPYLVSPSRNSDPGPHCRLFSPPTHDGSCLAFFREKISALSSLVDSHRIVVTHARRSQQLILFFSCK